MKTQSNDVKLTFGNDATTQGNILLSTGRRNTKAPGDILLNQKQNIITYSSHSTQYKALHIDTTDFTGQGIEIEFHVEVEFNDLIFSWRFHTFFHIGILKIVLLFIILILLSPP